VLLPPIVVALALFAAVSPQGYPDAAEQCQHAEGIERAHFQTTIFVRADVEDMMQTVFDAPLLAARVEEGRWRQLFQGAAGDQPHLSVSRCALVGAGFVQARDLRGAQEPQFGRLNRTGDQAADLATTAIDLFGAVGALRLRRLVRREKNRPAREF
jgi:hypothetical protein